jgi:predicted ATPase
MTVAPRFVGRAEELRELVGCLDRARSGRPQLTAVEGEAGIGKSRLLDELIMAAGRSGDFLTLAAERDADAANLANR